VKVGLVTKWFNRGQPVVARQLRSAVEELGHETFVLARPKKERGPRPGALDRDDVWDQPRVTQASAYDIPADEYRRWVDENGIEAILCDQNYQFEEIAELRRQGVRTVGRFVWEHFAAEHVAGATAAFDVIYSFTKAEQARYAEMGIDSPYITWGCHPELLKYARPAADGGGGEAPQRARVVFVFPGGFLGHRKPLEPVLDAFTSVPGDNLRLLIKAQVERRKLIEPAERAAAADSRIELQVADQRWDEHLRELAACDVSVAPARWEGLGLPLYEAIALGMPAITNDAPPMNEAITDDVNGLLVSSHQVGTAKSGIPALDPDVDELAAAIARLADPAERARLAEGAAEVRETERRWESTVEGIGSLLATATNV
jgi:glycosyltransferase involved in cell wall biosynthesis